MSIVICPRCVGYGRVYYDVGSHKSEYEYEKCVECKGSGRLLEDVTVTLKPFKPGKNESTYIH